jgi:acetoin utilization protein AcuB
MYLREYMQTNVITVSSDTLAHDAEKVMRDNHIRRLPVVDKGKLVGLITRDKLRRMLTPFSPTSINIWDLKYVPARIKVKDIMEKNIFTVTPDATLQQAIAEGQRRKIGVLLVVDKDEPDKLVGLVTATDVYRLTTGILGFGHPGARLHVFDPSKVGSCQEVLAIIIKQGVKILSLFHVTPPGTGREDCMLQLDTKDASQIIAELRSKGYEVEERPL